MAKQGEHGISWTQQTWNPVRGCSRVSPGCVNCYAENVAARFNGPGQAYEGLATRVGTDARWTGVMRLIPEHLADPMRWKRPRKIFVNSMSDLFHESLTNEQIAAVFGVMAAAPHHTFQILTKRAARMREWFMWAESQRWQSARSLCSQVAAPLVGRAWDFAIPNGPWPLPNVWLGVSVENQQYANIRIPHLLATHAAVRFASYEPALGPVDFASIYMSENGYWKHSLIRSHCEPPFVPDARLDWIIVGGESGPQARPFDVQWARDVVSQCRAAGVAPFVKQLGARPLVPAGRLRHWEWGGEISREARFQATDPMNESSSPWRVVLDSKKGGDPSEWPEDLRVQEFPKVTA